MLENVGCDEIITFNSMISSAKGFTVNSTFLNIDATELVVPYLIRRELVKPVIIASQGNEHYMNSINRLHQSFKMFETDCDLGFFSNNYTYVGDCLQGRDVILYNNMVRTGLSTKQHVKALKKLGAGRIYCFGFHGLCASDLFEDLIKQLPIEELIMTNTIFHATEV